jgi:hypothetical protein
MKQKKFWEDNYPNPLYKNDYKVALFTHAFSWTCFIHIPFLIFGLYIGYTPYNELASIAILIIVFIFNIAMHYDVDNMKANELSINLVWDQGFHALQLIATYAAYMAMFTKL